jgi:hypothetical protein
MGFTQNILNQLREMMMWQVNDRGELELDLRSGQVWAIAYVRRIEGTDLEVWSSIVTAAGTVTSQVHERLPDDQDGDVLARTKRHCEDVIKGKISEVIEHWMIMGTMLASPDELDDIERRLNTIEQVMCHDEREATLGALRLALSERRGQA